MADTRPLKILHLASFSGNIGDNANHMGFRPWLERQLGTAVVWQSLEIREFYWGERAWDEALVETINSHDLLVIGGGNYFELWVENSPTGTSMGFDEATFGKIRIPVFFNALGVDPGQGVPEVCRKRFSSFLSVLNGSDRYLVSVRNDGALENLASHVGEEYAERIHVLPDHGFFAGEGAGEADHANASSSHICINLAGDMPETRFSGFDCADGFAREMAELVSRLAADWPDHRLVFMPHIFRDLALIAQTLSFLPDRLRRTRIEVAPFGSGDEAARKLLTLYAGADLVLGMRFHANVCPLALRRPVVGLDCYVQIGNLYAELGLGERRVPVSRPGFSDRALALAHALPAPGGRDADLDKALNNVRRMRGGFEPVLGDWLKAQAISENPGSSG